jgi:casein kinase 1, epsilon
MSSSRHGSSSRRAVLSSSKPSSFGGDPSDPNRSSSRLISSSRSRPSTAKRAHHLGGMEGRSSSLSKIGRSSHDDTVRNMEMLSIGADRRR